MQTLTAQFTHYHAGFECTAYLTADNAGTLTIHTITRGQILYSKSAKKPTTLSTALADLRMWANSAPLY